MCVCVCVWLTIVRPSQKVGHSQVATQISLRSPRCFEQHRRTFHLGHTVQRREGRREEEKRGREGRGGRREEGEGGRGGRGERGK